MLIHLFAECLIFADADNIIVKNFTYLGTCIAGEGQLSVEVSSCLAKPSLVFGALRSSMFGNSQISVETKTHVYFAVVLSTLLRLRSWPVKATDTRQLSAFHYRCVSFILEVSKSEQCYENLSAGDILEQTGDAEDQSPAPSQSSLAGACRTIEC